MEIIGTYFGIVITSGRGDEIREVWTGDLTENILCLKFNYDHKSICYISLLLPSKSEIVLKNQNI